MDEDVFDTTELYKWLYESDVEQKARLDSDDKLVFGVYALITGLATFYFGLLPLAKFEFGVGGLFWMFAIAFFLCFLAGIVCLIIGMLPRFRAYVGSGNEFSDYEVGLVEHYSFEKDGEAARRLAAKDVEQLLREHLVTATETNRAYVLQKTFYQVRAKWASAAAILVFLLNAYPAYVVREARSNVQKIDIIELPNDEQPRIITEIENRRSGNNGRGITRTAAGQPASGSTGRGSAKTGNTATKAGKAKGDDTAGGLRPPENEKVNGLANKEKLEVSDQQKPKPAETQTPPKQPQKPEKPPVTRVLGTDNTKININDPPGDKLEE